MIVALDLDRVLAQHLAFAVTRHLRLLAAQDKRAPAELADLAATFRLVARGVMSGQERPGTDGVVPVGDARAVTDDREYLSAREVAVLLGLSERTVRRRLDAGEIPSSRIGRARRVARSDLEKALGGHR